MDELVDARYLADRAYWGSNDPQIEGLATAVKYLADAIEETNTRIRNQMDDAQAAYRKGFADAVEDDADGGVMDELIEQMAEAMSSYDDEWHKAVAQGVEDSGHGYDGMARAALDSLTAAGYEVVKLPEPESTGHEDDGNFDWWTFPWDVTADSTGQVSDETGCELTSGDAWSLGASWLAAAKAAEAVSDD